MQRSARHNLEPTSLLGLALHDAGVLRRGGRGRWDLRPWSLRLESLGVALRSGDVSVLADPNPNPNPNPNPHRSPLTSHLSP